MIQLEWDFLSELLHVVGPSHATSVRTALLGDASTRGVVPGRLLSELQERPLTVLLGNANAAVSDDGSPATPALLTRKPVLYVCRFPGDATASQVDFLREEVTAIVRAAREGDEALVVLQTGGGTVTGYGLAASQLVRLKSKLKLTVAVEQVAASGGYMMCCVADRIVASPFAVLGSIGVISDIPNVYERLKKEGIEFQTVTAGKYKRTLTPTKKVTREDLEKTKLEIEDILILFRDFVAANRPQLDMDQVATGETWFGKDALERKLCDEIKPVDDVICDYIDAGFDVFEVEYSPPYEDSALSQLLQPAGSLRSSDTGGWLRKVVRKLVATVAAEVRAELGPSFGSETPIEQRVMAISDDADRVRSQ
jgi:signal peptide peptidase SppA